MKKYAVKVIRTFPSAHTFIVEADTKERAEEIAMGEANDYEFDSPEEDETEVWSTEEVK